KERNQGSRQKLMELGRWPGGRPIYGYKAVELPEGGYKLDVDPISSMILFEAISRTLGGEPLNRIVADFNERDILSPADYYRYATGQEVRGDPWDRSTLRRILASPARRGFIMYEGKPFLKDDGTRVTVGAPLVSYEDHKRLVAVLDEAADRYRKQTRDRKDATPWLGALKCMDCGKNLVRQQSSRDYGKKEYVYYRCRDRCFTGLIRADILEELLETQFLETFGE